MGTSVPSAAVSEMMIANPSARPTAASPRPNSTEPIPQPMPNNAVESSTVPLAFE